MSLILSKKQRHAGPLLSRFAIANYDAAKTLVWEYIETFYNTVRIHSHNNYLSPNERERMYKKMVTRNVKALAS